MSILIGFIIKAWPWLLGIGAFSYIIHKHKKWKLAFNLAGVAVAATYIHNVFTSLNNQIAGFSVATIWKKIKNKMGR
jgi:hypothetical protein